MNKNEISLKTLHPEANLWIKQLQTVLLIEHKAKATARNYVNEMLLFFKYYNHLPVDDITQAGIEQYMVYIVSVHKVGRAKCRSFASACSFFYKKVIKKDYILPSSLYPQKQFKLPNIMSQPEVEKLFTAPLTLKQYCIIGLLYGCGLRISEVAALRIQDIETANRRLKVCQGKGAKDRYTLLPDFLLPKLREYYVTSSCPKTYLFTSPQTKRQYHTRSMQTEVDKAMAAAGFAAKDFTAHTLRHSFATHMLDNGSNIFVIKTFLGHSDIQTTMVYLHLQQHTQFGIISPLDVLMGGKNA
jgi:site-specific recombinase XerD